MSRIPGALSPTYTFLSVRDTDGRVFPPTDVSNGKATRSSSENCPIHPYPSKVSRPDPGPVTREGALTNPRRFLERMVARAER
jgi:hypothetical protein